MLDDTPDKAVTFALSQLDAVPDAALDEIIRDMIDGLFLRGYPDVVAAMWRQSGVPEGQVFEAVMDAADRLGLDPDLVGELVYGQD